MLRNEYLIIHCSTGDDLVGDDSKRVLQYALANGWTDHPYDAYVEDENGNAVFDFGRSLTKPGGHCRTDGMNSKATGYAWVGGDLNLGFKRIADDSARDSLSYAKYNLMVQKAADWCIEHKRTVDRIKFHSELDKGKTCPGVGLSPHTFRGDVQVAIGTNSNQKSLITRLMDINTELLSIIKEVKEGKL